MPPDFFGTFTRGLDHVEMECWIKPAAIYETKIASACLKRIEFNLYGRDWTGCGPGGTIISKGRREHAP